MADLISAFPRSLYSEAKAVAGVLQHHLKSPSNAIEVRICDEAIAIPYRVYGGEHALVYYNDEPFRLLAGLLRAQDFNERQQLMFFCLLSRHHNGFVREAALCRIAASPEAFIVPFVAQLASEYVYEILLQISLRLPELEPQLYGAFFRGNPAYFARLRQRMISYWNVYYRWQDYTSPDGEMRHAWRDHYVGFDIFDAFDAMIKVT